MHIAQPDSAFMVCRKAAHSYEFAISACWPCSSMTCARLHMTHLPPKRDAPCQVPPWACDYPEAMPGLSQQRAAVQYGLVAFGLYLESAHRIEQHGRARGVKASAMALSSREPPNCASWSRAHTNRLVNPFSNFGGS